MIVYNKEIKRSQAIFKSVVDQLLKKNLDIDGTIDIFNDGNEKGAVFKIFEKYNPASDICIWVYLPQNRKSDNQMTVLLGVHNDCKANNFWSSNVTSKNFSNNIARELHKEVSKYVLDIITSRLNKLYKIENGKDIDENE